MKMIRSQQYLVLTDDNRRFFFLTEARALNFHEKTEGSRYVGLTEVPQDALPPCLQAGSPLLG